MAFEHSIINNGEIMYRDIDYGTIYRTKEEAIEAFTKKALKDPWYLSEIAFEHGPTLYSVIQWLESIGKLEDFYNSFKDDFDEGVKEFAEMWVEDFLVEVQRNTVP